MSNSEDRLSELGVLKAQRKNGDIGVVAYYKGLLAILAQTVEHLDGESISEKDARSQIPLVLVFLEEQLATLKGRGG